MDFGKWVPLWIWWIFIFAIVEGMLSLGGAAHSRKSQGVARQPARHRGGEAQGGRARGEEDGPAMKIHQIQKGTVLDSVLDKIRYF